MAKRGSRGTSRGKADNQPHLSDFRHDSATRKNNPPAKIAAEGSVPAIPRVEYRYSPRRPPVLRFDPNGQPDALPELLAKATRAPLTPEEAALLAEALRTHEPWLEWASKHEQHQRGHFSVDPVALHIHERVSAQAILKVAARQDAQRSLFADPQHEYREAVQFYKHDIDWANRLILGDSLAVMSSLARREDLAGKVQMIYLDPPYGIKFASNFQPEVGRRDVKDKEQDLTREPEMVRAYRDTWHLGIHSYLSYLRDRLIVAKELLADTGSIFVQISNENLHRVRSLLDEVFGVANGIATITFRTTSSRGGNYLGQSANYLLWYGRDIAQTRWRSMYKPKGFVDDIGGRFSRVHLSNGTRRPLTTEERDDISKLGQDDCIYRHDNLTSQSGGDNSRFPVEFCGMSYTPGRGFWKTNVAGFLRLFHAERLGAPTPNSLAYVRYLEDFPVSPISEVWTDTQTGAFTDEKVYAVQTNAKVIERCMLMTTDPGELVLDPTCGSGTTAYVAEQWGRRWITCDTSRVAVAIARQRLLTAKFEMYRTRHEGTEARRDEGTPPPKGRGGNGHENPAANFVYKTVPHITLKSIAQNTNLDPIFARHEPILEAALAACNKALKKATAELRRDLEAKLARKQREEGKKSITDADRRRWELPNPQASSPKPQAFQHWTVPFDTDADWPKELQEAVTAYRTAWRAKMDEVNACIAASAEQEELVDQPEVVRGVVRVSGPFTVEAVQPPEMTLGENIDPHTGDTPSPFEGEGRGEGEFDGAPSELPDGFETRALRIVESRPDLDAKNVEAYLDQMIRYLRMDGVRFPNNKQMMFTRLEPLWQSGRSGMIHAEGRWVVQGDDDAEMNGRPFVAVSFGPQYGPVTAQMVEECVRMANRGDYQELVLAAFSFDGPAQAAMEEISGKPQGSKLLNIHAAHVRPDVNPAMAGLLKEQPGSQLFTVFGQPRTKLDGPDADGMYTVTMEGVDIYNPVENVTVSTGADKVAAWFLDSDYDGWTFCITQAFFPDRSAWDKLSRALNGPGGVIDEERFAALSGTVSLPFAPGKHKCAAVKVIDPRGNEVMRVERL